MTYYDREGTELKDGDIIDLHQTVNGENLFVVYVDNGEYSVEYLENENGPYEYDVKSLLEPCKYSGETDYEIIGNIEDELCI